MSGRQAFRLRTLLVGKTDRAEIQVLRSAAAAHLGFWADLATLAVLTEIIGLYYLISAALAFTVGLLVAYGLSVLWIFKHRRIQNRFAEFAAFSLIGLVGVVVMLAVNFTVRRVLLFRPQRL